MKLNVGCGGRRYDGWVGVDVVARDNVDIVAEVTKIPLPDGCASEIMGIHVVEHLFFWDVPVALAEWNRLLRVGGQLVLEMPDVIKCCQNVIDGRMKGGKDPKQLSYWGLYGDDRTCDPYMVHRYGWTFKTLRPLVQAAGFTNVVERQTKFHPAGRDYRDFRIEAIKA